MTTSPSAPASDEPVYEIDSFEVLWYKHKTKIIAGALSVVVAIVAVFGWLIISNARRAAADDAFSKARTEADYRALIAKYPSSPVAGDASLLLAKILRDEKKFDEANGVLADFSNRQPSHPLVAVAKVAMAENLALMGKLKEAVQALNTFGETDGESFAVPFAWMVSADLSVANGQREEAVRTYERLGKSFPGSVAAQASAPALQVLQSLMARPNSVPANAAPAGQPAPSGL